MIMPVKAAGIIVFRTANAVIEYLLLQASYGVCHWSPPKGHVDPGESDNVTAWRETEEETGLQKAQLSIIPDFEKNLTYQVGDEQKTVTYWIAKLKSHDTHITLSKEHTQYKWATIDEAEKLIKHESLVNFMKDAHIFLMSRGHNLNDKE